jgi:hypothetical protein
MNTTIKWERTAPGVYQAPFGTTFYYVVRINSRVWEVIWPDGDTTEYSNMRDAKADVAKNA